MDNSFHFVAGADGNGGFGDDYGKTIQRMGNFLCRCIDITEIGMAVPAPRRRADRDEDHVGLGNGGGKIGGEAQPPGFGIVGDDGLQTRLEDRDMAIFQGFDLFRHLVDANHVMAEICKTRAGHKADITRTDHHNPHSFSFRLARPW